MTQISFPIPYFAQLPVRLPGEQAPRNFDFDKTVASVALSLGMTPDQNLEILLGEDLSLDLRTSTVQALQCHARCRVLSSTSLYELCAQVVEERSGRCIIIAIGSEKNSIPHYLANCEASAQKLYPEVIQGFESAISAFASLDRHAAHVIQDLQGNFKVLQRSERQKGRPTSQQRRGPGWALGGMAFGPTSTTDAKVRGQSLDFSQDEIAGLDFSDLGKKLRDYLKSRPNRLWITGLGPRLTNLCLRDLHESGCLEPGCRFFVPDLMVGSHTCASSLEMLATVAPGDCLLDFSYPGTLAVSL